jgi:hypothetical protein
MPTPDSNSGARYVSGHGRHCLDRRRHIEPSIYRNQRCELNRFFDGTNRKNCDHGARIA